MVLVQAVSAAGAASCSFVFLPDSGAEHLDDDMAAESQERLAVSGTDRGVVIGGDVYAREQLAKVLTTAGHIASSCSMVG